MKNLKDFKKEVSKEEAINKIMLKKTVGGGAICAALCVYELNKVEQLKK